MSTGVYAKTAGDLIRDALRAATISGIALPVQSEDFVQGESALNDILMSLQTEQIHVWAQTEALIPLNPDQTKYVFGTDHAFTNYVYTTSERCYCNSYKFNRCQYHRNDYGRFYWR